MFGENIQLSVKPIIFPFEDGIFVWLGPTKIRIPTPHSSFISSKTEIFQQDILLFIGLAVLHKHQFVVANVVNKRFNELLGWTLK